MEAMPLKPNPRRIKSAFTLVEMLVVIAIISILMTAGSIGLSGMGGKGVTSGVATAESLFDEARSTAVGRNIRSCILVAEVLENNPADNLKRIVVAHEEVDKDTGLPTAKDGAEPTWVLSSRGAVLPDQVYFSEVYSQKDMESSGGELETVTLSDVSNTYKGSYFIYRFNAQGICSTPGASFVIGNGAKKIVDRASGEFTPVVSASGKRDFGGFVIWRNGRTSVFRSPDQIASSFPDTGKPF